MNEQPGLASTHIVWSRIHNQIAERLSVLNPQWGDEVSYQESRRIIGAMVQQITYNEYLPMIIGWKMMEQYVRSSFLAKMFMCSGFSCDCISNIFMQCT